jgi:hypothetical protein
MILSDNALLALVATPTAISLITLACIFASWRKPPVRVRRRNPKQRVRVRIRIRAHNPIEERLKIMKSIFRIAAMLALGAAIITISAVTAKGDEIYTYTDSTYNYGTNGLCASGLADGCLVTETITIDEATALPGGLTQTVLGGPGTGTSAPVSWSMVLSSCGWDGSNYDLCNPLTDISSASTLPANITSPVGSGTSIPDPLFDFQTNAAGAITAWSIASGDGSGDYIISTYLDTAYQAYLCGNACAQAGAGTNGELDLGYVLNSGALGLSSSSIIVGQSSLGNWSMESTAPPVSPAPEPVWDALILVAVLFVAHRVKARLAKRAPGTPTPDDDEERDTDPLSVTRVHSPGHLVAELRSRA